MKKITRIALFLILCLPLPVLAGVILLTENTPPANYLDSTGQPAGLAVELVQEMARRVGDPGRIQVVPWARGYKDTLENPDTALFHTVWTLERDESFQWVGPLFPTEIVLYKKSGSSLKISSIEDARKVHAIGTYKEDAKEQLLKKMGFTNLESTVDDLQNPKKLVAGRIDLWPVNALQVKTMLDACNLPTTAIEPVFLMMRQQAYLAFSTKTDPALVAKWQNALEEMEQDGTANRIRAAYGLKPQPVVAIYTEEDFPRNYSENGVLKGRSVEIIRHMLRRATDGSPIIMAKWSRGYNDTLRQENTALFSMARTPERETLFKWVGPISRTRTVFIARKGAGLSIKSLDDAKKYGLIGTYKDDTNEQYLKLKGFSNLDSDVSQEAIPRKLLEGRLALWIVPDDTYKFWIKKAGYDPAAFEVVYAVREYDSYLGVSLKVPSSVVGRWQTALDSMRSDGTLQKIHTKWIQQL